MTNKKFRDDLAKEMYDRYNERNEKLEQVDKLPLSESVKKLEKKEIMEAFFKEMDEMKSRPGYEEARRTHLEEIKAKIKLAKSRNKKERLQKEYEERLAEADANITDSEEAYKKARIAHRVGEETETLYGNRKKILEYLKHSVKVEKNVEMMGYKGKKVHINLPAVKGKFKGFKFEYFVSNECVEKTDFESNPELEKKSYSVKDVGGLLRAMNKYMGAMGVKIDWEDLDYENALKCWWGQRGKTRCDAGDCLKNITGLDYDYWLKEKNIFGLIDHSRVFWNCDYSRCRFLRDYHGDAKAKLFLKLS